MSALIACDVCGQPGHAVKAAVVIDELVGPGTSTGHEEVADACDDHEAAVIEALSAHCLAMLNEQEPHLVKIADHAAARDEAMAEFTAYKPTLAAFEAVDEKRIPDEVKKKRDEIIARGDDAEAARLSALEDATAASDARVAAFRASLRSLA